MTQQNPASPDGETLHAKLQRLATWLEVAETNFGGLPEGVSLREVWVTMRQAALALAPRPAHEVQAERIDTAVSRCYRRFKDWSNRKFNADDVTWCEVRADLIAIAQAMIASAPRPDADAKLAEILDAFKATWKRIHTGQPPPVPDDWPVKVPYAILLSLTERAASLEKENTQLKAQVREPLTTDGWRLSCIEARSAASEALQECERLKATIKAKEATIDACIRAGTRSRALGAAK